MKRFQNLNPKKKSKNFFQFLAWKLASKKVPWPKELPIISKDKPPEKISDNQIRISYIGHTTFLIQSASINILTDPIWSKRASPFKNYGPKRVFEPGVNFEDLPKIDIVLISHNHYDHMDIPSINDLYLRDNPLFITPLKNELILKKNINNITVNTLAWHESLTFNDQLKIYLEPAQHWSRRSLLDKNKALWGTFVIQFSNAALVFIGDSGYSPEIFKDIGQKFNSIQVALIPIGAFEPRWFMRDIHMDPKEALCVHQDLNAKFSIASHFAVFPLADEGFDQAQTELSIAKKEMGISDKHFILPEVGQVYWF